MALQNFLHFGALPESIRHDIWERAVHDLLSAKPAVQLMRISRRDTCLAHERQLVDEARTAVLNAAQADPGMDWGDIRMVSNLHMRLNEAGRDTARKHRATLVTVTPVTPHGRRLGTFSASWPMNDLAACCTEVHAVLKRHLRVQARNHDGSNFDPTNDIVCLSGFETPEPNGTTRGLPLFDNVHAVSWTPSGSLTRVLERQVVVVGCMQGLDAVSDFGSHEHRLRSPSLYEICPPMASLRRIAFEFRPEVAIDPGALALSIFHYCHRLGFKALRPYNLPGLQEVYLIEESIKLKASAVGQRLKQQLGSVPSFAGCFGTFYEVGPNETYLWDIPMTDHGQMPVFLCARYLETGTLSTNGPVPNPPLGFPVKVLAFVRHTE